SEMGSGSLMAQSAMVTVKEYRMTSNSQQDADMTNAATRAVIDRFNEAFNRHDLDALANLLTDDTVFVDTSPVPDGRRIEGKPAVIAFWREWFLRNADAHFDSEEVIVSGDRAV